MWFNGFSLFPSLFLSFSGVKIVPSITVESSGLFSVRSELNMVVVKENKDDKFYCEVNYQAPGGESRMTETDPVNVTVYCECGCSRSVHFEQTRCPFSERVRFILAQCKTSELWPA